MPLQGLPRVLAGFKLATIGILNPRGGGVLPVSKLSTGDFPSFPLEFKYYVFKVAIFGHDFSKLRPTLILIFFTETPIVYILYRFYTNLKTLLLLKHV